VHPAFRMFAKSVVSAVALLSAAGCAFSPADVASSVSPISAYCPLIASPKTFPSGITLSGTALYQYRNDGNGAVPDGTNTWKPVVAVAFPTTYTLNVNGHLGSYTCVGAATCTVLNIVNGIQSGLHTTLAATGLDAHGMTAVDIFPTNGVEGSVSITASSTGAGTLIAQGPRPIRRAEVQILNDAGAIVQCAETDGSGLFTTTLPAGGAHYTVNVMARAANAYNNAYVMNNPTANSPYKISAGVQSTTSTSVTLVAPVSGTMMGGAFNILDQILNAQTYLRTTTAACGTAATPTYLAGCNPVTTVPIVYTYWTLGLSPNVYYGSNDPISYYLIGKSQLFIGGGSAGDSTNSDMDQFDNSVIVHEYGHFIEDKFGKPNSPGGSHSGQYVIDPRLAWGEGWANFFQAAVAGIPMYRDTYGSVTCGSATCATGSAFLEPLESGTPYNAYKTDVPAVLGEGNFHEFSISRVLWSIIQPTVSQFSEVWTVFNGSTGMGLVNDPFKTVGRFHVIQSNFAAGANKTDWSASLTAEKQVADFTGYATPVDLTASCATSSIAMTAKRDNYDDGSYTYANQFRNNDFYIYNHAGGALPVSLTWSGAGSVDLDIYIYGAGYVFGSSSSILAKDIRDSNGSSTGSAIGTSGSASVNPSLPAGLYIINVMAATGSMTVNTSSSTTYALSIANHAACPLSL
jgi:hypothetical protein